MKKHPQNLKFKKYFKQSIALSSQYDLGLSKLNSRCGLQATEKGKLTPSEIESCRISIRRKLGKKKKIINLWIKVFPYVSYTKKSVGMRMGKGKGSREGWFCPISKGYILYELNKHSDGTFVFSYFKAFANSWRKLSLFSKVIFKIY